MGHVRSRQDVLSKVIGADKVGADPVGAYFSYEPVESVIERTEIFLGEGNEHLKHFSGRYALFANAMDALRSRAELWIRMLEDPDSVDPAVLDAAGKTHLGRRLAFAIHCALEDAEKLSEKMEELMSEFVSHVFRYAGKTDSKAFLDGLVGFGSPCEVAGVCVCRCEPPYQRSCLGGQDAILPRSPEQQEEAAQRFSKGLSSILSGLDGPNESST